MEQRYWQEELQELTRMEARALRILGVRAGVSRRALKLAFRSAVKRHHPDLNRGDAQAQERLRDAVAAYRFLAEAEPDKRLLAPPAPEPRPVGCGYYLDNSWGYFLWWRESFFSQDGPGM